jgi:hypothetical protein
MTHEIARLLLEHAESFLDRSEAVKTALSLGMPLHGVEAYLDWLDMVRGPLPPGTGATELTDRGEDSPQDPP